MKKRIIISGATGFVGSTLVRLCAHADHEPIAWVRDADRARKILGEAVALVDSREALVDALGSAHGVVHLAGSPIANGRWSDAVKRDIMASRVASTEDLVACMAKASRVPPVFVCASGVGFYGLHGGVAHESESQPGDDFLAHVCVAWEAAADHARALGVRVVHARLGMVLGLHGGALQKLLPLFSLGLGGRLGHGNQAVPWIHVDDATRALLFAVENEAVHGAINCVAPEQISNRILTQTLAETLHRPALMHVPAFALRLALGDMASMVLEGRHASPDVLLAHGFTFSHPTLKHALQDLVGS